MEDERDVRKRRCDGCRGSSVDLSRTMTRGFVVPIEVKIEDDELYAKACVNLAYGHASRC